MLEYLTGLRSWARSLGLLRFVAAPLQWGEQRRHRQSCLRAEQEYAELKHPDAVIVNAGGVQFRMRVRNVSEYVLFRASREVHVANYFVNALGPGDLMWDVGANVGFYTLLGAAVVGLKGNVVAFEPHGPSRQILQANIACNGFMHVHVQPIALGNRRCQLSMLSGAEAPSGVHRLDFSSSSVNRGAVAGSSCEHLAEVWVGDVWRESSGAVVPKLIKMDIEGAEGEAVEGLRLTLSEPGCRIFIVEVHFSILSSRGLDYLPRRMMLLLRSAGFNRFCWLDSSHLAAEKR